jgi:hypothetical protein
MTKSHFSLVSAGLLTNPHVPYMAHRIRKDNITPQWLGQVLLDNNITRKRTRKSHFPKTRYGKKISYKKEIKTFFKTIKKYKLE